MHFAFSGGGRSMNNEKYYRQSKPQKMNHFLEICLLMILYEQSGYGYDFMNQLSEYGFTQEELNIGSLYRVLRKMETRDLIVSKWETSAQGPDKRIYEMTETGKSQLSRFMEVLKERQEKIKLVLEKYYYLKGGEIL